MKKRQNEGAAAEPQQAGTASAKGAAAGKHLAARKKGHRVRNTLLGLLAAVVVAAIASTFVLCVVEVRGSSMEPELRGGSYAFILRGNQFGYGDVAAFTYQSKTLVKRVVALPGDVVDVKSDGTVFLNGAELEERYALFVRAAVTSEDAVTLEYPYTVPEDSYFVVADNRADNSDSRNPEIAALPKSAAVGKVIGSL